MILLFLMHVEAIDSLTQDELRLFLLVDVVMTTTFGALLAVVMGALWEAWYGWPLF